MPDPKSQTTVPISSLIRTGNPPVEAGLFIVYTDPLDYCDPRFMSRSLLLYLYGSWSHYESAIPFTGIIHGWIGPIPSLLIQEKIP